VQRHVEIVYLGQPRTLERSLIPRSRRSQNRGRPDLVHLCAVVIQVELSRSRVGTIGDLKLFELKTRCQFLAVRDREER